MKKLLQKILFSSILFALAVICCFPATFRGAASAEEKKGLEATTVEEDLEDINKLLYPQNSKGSFEIIRFQEYCFSNDDEVLKNYGLYLYVYNPSQIALREDNVFHAANMATGYDLNGSPVGYENIRLTVVDGTENNRFYKLKVSKPSKLLEMATAYADKHEGERRYDIVGLQLYSGLTLVKDESVSATYYYNGFAVGCSEGTTTESSLTCRVDKLQTITLDINHTNWRTESYLNDKDGEGDYCYEINTVYFSVPKSYFNDYGGLQKITAEWHEYKTNPIYVTSDSGAYSALNNFVGVDIGDATTQEDLPWRVLWDIKLAQGVYTADFFGEWDHYLAYGAYNAGMGVNSSKGGTLTELDNMYCWGHGYDGYAKGNEYPINYESRIDWLFYVKNANTRADYSVTSWQLEEWMRTYTARFAGQERLNGYAEGLFSDSIDAERVALLEDPTATRGYVKQEINADDQETILEKVDDRKWWEKFLGFPLDSAEIPYEPIAVFTMEDLSELEGMTDFDFEEKYYVTKPEKNDGSSVSLRAYCVSELKRGNNPVLFHFANTKYYASTARFDKAGNLMSAEDGYVAQETLFLDFDVISLTFRNNNGVEKVLGVVSDPFDIINGLDAPPGLDPEADRRANQIAAALALFFLLAIVVAGLILLAVYAPPVFNAIMGILGKLLNWGWIGFLWIVSAPFKLIGLIYKGISSLCEK